MIEELGDKLDEEDDDERILPNVKDYQSKQDDYTLSTGQKSYSF